MRRILFFLIVTLAVSSIPSLTAAPPRPESILASIQIPWQQLGYDIVFKPPQHGYRAMTFPAKHRIEVYQRPEDSLDLLMYDIAHELGHVIDVTYNTEESRKRWMRARGINP